MAKPNDTPFDPPFDPMFAPASANPNRSSTRYPPEFVALLQSLLASHASAPPTPVPPKHCRPKRIRPRRRITVHTSLDAASPPDIPWIRLCGRWLAIAGFGVHTRARIHVAHRVLILIPEDTH